MSSNEIMHEIDWKDDGGEGCLMSLVKVGVFTAVMAAVVVLAYAYAPELMNLWW